jgi:hypothetical protein
MGLRPIPHDAQLVRVHELVLRAPHKPPVVLLEHDNPAQSTLVLASPSLESHFLWPRFLWVCTRVGGTMPPTESGPQCYWLAVAARVAVG